MKEFNTYEALVGECRALSFDLDFSASKNWKSQQPGRILVGYLPIYFPREIVHAANGMAVGIMGSGDGMQIVKGDAYYQSYICHMPRGVVELALNGNLKDFDGFIFPSICDVIRNLSGIFRLQGTGRFAKYLDFPQNFDPVIGGTFYRTEMQHVIDEMKKINGVELTTEKLNNSIKLYNRNRQLIEDIYAIRQKYPWRMPAEDIYVIVRAGMVMPVEEHNKILEQALAHIKQDIGEPMDKIKVVVTGAFCEQPPLGVIRTIEMAGCYVVDDDFLLGSRWIQGNVPDDTDDPLNALVDAYLEQSTFSSSVYDADKPKGERLVKLVQDRQADGVIFSAPSFCDPALLDQPQLIEACDKAGVKHITFQYSENTGQYKVIKEQVGTFSDSIKLWEDQEIVV